MRALRNVGRLFTAGEAVRVGVDVLIDGDHVAAVVAAGEGRAEDEFDCGGGLLTSGLIDAHTHPVYWRPRLEEVSRRAKGASYQQLAGEGGGIHATVRETRAAPLQLLEQVARSRFASWIKQGTTTVEAKTGYWLEEPGEIAGVRLLAGLADDPALPRLVVTFLAAHEVPPEYSGDREGYVEAVCSWCPAAKSAGAQFCDVFCDQGAFSVEESARILLAAKSAGLGLRLHADELALTGGAHLGARLKAASADHLLQVGDEEIRALAAAGTAATLCPVTALTMGRLPPARRLLEQGVTLALGTDHNPGTSGTTSMSLIVYLAVTEFKLDVEQALAAATLGGARSLLLTDRGAVSQGQLADLVLWDADHEGAFAWEPGLRPRFVWRAGHLVTSDA
ncbi:MAG: imidazolonepropionase [Candidatus Dormibacteria bacterium]